MEKQSKGLTALSILMGLIFTIVGVGNMFIFKAGYYQEMISTSPMSVALIMFLSVFVTIGGVWLIGSAMETSANPNDFLHQKRSTAGIFLILAGSILIICGILSSVFFNSTYLESSTRNIVLQIVNFLLIYAGLFTICFNVWIANWIEEKISNHHQKRASIKDLKEVYKKIDGFFEKYQRRNK